MPETVIKIPGLTQIFTIDEREKTVAVISRNWRKVVSQHKFEAEKLVPEYCEKMAAVSRLFPLILAWWGVVLGLGLSGEVLYFAVKDKDTAIMFSLLLAALLGPVLYFRQSL